MLAALNAATAPVVGWLVDNVAVTASTAATWVSNIDAILATQENTLSKGILNLGANDVVAAVTEVAYKADMLYLIDAVSAKWPGIQVYVCKPWHRGYDAACDAMAGWIDDIVAARSNCSAGHDERVWMKSDDDGATFTIGDGLHYYSGAGATECATQCTTLLLS